jgi:hypothetical protein
MVSKKWARELAVAASRHRWWTRITRPYRRLRQRPDRRSRPAPPAQFVAAGLVSSHMRALFIRSSSSQGRLGDGWGAGRCLKLGADLPGVAGVSGRGERQRHSGIAVTGPGVSLGMPGVTTVLHVELGRDRRRASGRQTGVDGYGLTGMWPCRNRPRWDQLMRTWTALIRPARSGTLRATCADARDGRSERGYS